MVADLAQETGNCDKHHTHRGASGPATLDDGRHTGRAARPRANALDRSYTTQ
jgi:hypothetical protein